MAESLMRRTIAIIKLLAGVALITVLAWLSLQYPYKTDLSSHQRNTLPPEAAAVLKSLQGPLKLTAVVNDSPELHRRIEKSVERLQQTQSGITLDFVSPQTRITQKNTELNQSGHLELEYNGNQETLHSLSEKDIIAAIRRLIHGGERWAVFIEGHDEKSLFDKTATGYEKLDALLQKQGYHTQSLNLVKLPEIPDNTTLLVLAAPQTPMLPGELKVIVDYVQNGGNFLWLKEPQQTLEKLQETIPVEFIPGVVISNNTKMREVLGIQHPAVIPIVDYGTHKISKDLNGTSLFAITSAVRFNGESPWESTAFLLSLAESWNETGDLQGRVKFDKQAGESPGPLSIGIALTRPNGELTQRIAVVGDSDFLSNDYLGYGQNPKLAANLFNWLSGDTCSLEIPVRPTPDAELKISDSTLLTLSVVFLIILPLGFVLIGIRLWFRRRKG
jgi:hypothetical protein